MHSFFLQHIVAVPCLRVCLCMSVSVLAPGDFKSRIIEFRVWNMLYAIGRPCIYIILKRWDHTKERSDGNIVIGGRVAQKIGALMRNVFVFISFATS